MPCTRPPLTLIPSDRSQIQQWLVAYGTTTTSGASMPDRVGRCGGLVGQRGGSGNSDSVISGSLASLKPPDGGAPEEQGHEENETESRRDA